MINSQEAFSQFALTLVNHFDSVYYIDAKTCSYLNLHPIKILEMAGLPFHGDNFFKDALKYIKKCIYPDDISIIKSLFNKALIDERLAENDFYNENYRLIIDNKITHIRHTEFLTPDKDHIIICMENIEESFKKYEEQKKSLESAERMARFDQLTGVRNKNAYQEYIEEINKKIKENAATPFAVILCDMNNLKIINDTQGHSFGDDAIQQTSRMICNIFSHSPIFRIGGDEFIIILNSRDYEKKDLLIKSLKAKSLRNRLSHSGPVVASGMAVFNPESDDSFSKVFERADKQMYNDKNELKSTKLRQVFTNLEAGEKEIPIERKHLLDTLFEGLYSMSGGGYVYLDDMHYDYSRWSLQLVEDFNIESEYMYHADKIWQEHIHPDDIQAYKDVVNAILSKSSTKFKPLTYRALRADGKYVALSARGFVLYGTDGSPDYFGGIIIPQ